MKKSILTLLSSTVLLVAAAGSAGAVCPVEEPYCESTVIKVNPSADVTFDFSAIETWFLESPRFTHLDLQFEGNEAINDFTHLVLGETQSQLLGTLFGSGTTIFPCEETINEEFWPLPVTVGIDLTEVITSPPVGGEYEAHVSPLPSIDVESNENEVYRLPGDFQGTVGTLDIPEIQVTYPDGTTLDVKLTMSNKLMWFGLEDVDVLNCEDPQEVEFFQVPFGPDFDGKEDVMMALTMIRYADRCGARSASPTCPLGDYCAEDPTGRFLCGAIPPEACTTNFDADLCRESITSCSGSASGEEWSNRGQYLSNLSRAVAAAYREGSITAEQRNAIQASGVASNCGNP